MTNAAIVAIKNRICQGLPTRIPPMFPHELAILLNELAADREEIQGPFKPTTNQKHRPSPGSYNRDTMGNQTMKAPIAAALLLASISTYAATKNTNEPQMTPVEKAALKQAQAEMEALTPQKRDSLVFSEESQQCLSTAQAYAELVKDLPTDTFIKLSSKYCFHGADIAHKRNAKAMKQDWIDMGKENVSLTVQALLKHSEMRGIAIGHQLEVDAVEDRYFQLAHPEFGLHKFHWEIN